MFLSKIVISTRHIYTYKCGGKPATYRFFFCFCFLGGGGVGGLDYFLFQLLSELCFPTWLFAFSKVCFTLSDQASM